MLFKDTLPWLNPGRNRHIHSSAACTPQTPVPEPVTRIAARTSESSDRHKQCHSDVAGYLVSSKRTQLPRPWRHACLHGRCSLHSRSCCWQRQAAPSSCSACSYSSRSTATLSPLLPVRPHFACKLSIHGCAPSAKPAPAPSASCKWPSRKCPCSTAPDTHADPVETTSHVGTIPSTIRCRSVHAVEH